METETQAGVVIKRAYRRRADGPVSSRVEPPAVPNVWGVAPEEWVMLTTAQRERVNTEHGHAACKTCSKPLEYRPSVIADWMAGKVIKPRYCDRCASAQSHHKPASDWWRDHCPRAMQKTVLEQLPNRAATERVLAWQYGSRGLLLHGPARHGKTRSLWLLLKRLAAEGRSIRFYDGTAWGNECAQRFVDKSVYHWLDACCMVGVLVIDDIDKSTWTERVKNELLAVIRARCDQGLPVIVATQVSDSLLQEQLGPAVGDALIGRLLEFCEMVEF